MKSFSFYLKLSIEFVNSVISEGERKTAKERDGERKRRRKKKTAKERDSERKRQRKK